MKFFNFFKKFNFPNILYDFMKSTFCEECFIFIFSRPKGGSFLLGVTPNKLFNVLVFFRPSSPPNQKVTSYLACVNERFISFYCIFCCHWWCFCMNFFLMIQLCLLNSKCFKLMIAFQSNDKKKILSWNELFLIYISEW